MPIKAVIFDYIGTLVNCRGYSMQDSEDNLYRALCAEGFEMEKAAFLDAYNLAHQKYRRIRYEEYREVTNAVWVAEALGTLGFTVTPADNRVKAALNVFFQDFIDTLELRSGAKTLLRQTGTQAKLGLISNFTHGPVIHRSLRKIGIHPYFHAIVVSQDVGWRKPSSRIFQDTLARLQVKAEEAVFVGDSPIEDIGGAKNAGIKTVFVPSQFNSLKDLAESQQVADEVAEDLAVLREKLLRMLSP
ncbi:MAG: HAD family hydrolase [Candidatus Bathyarchaeota archaeon]|nr:HAD family hydrolase [Candidatus Bathyarchaeota archaeon]